MKRNIVLTLCIVALGGVSAIFFNAKKVKRNRRTVRADQSRKTIGSKFLSKSGKFSLSQNSNIETIAILETLLKRKNEYNLEGISKERLEALESYETAKSFHDEIIHEMPLKEIFQNMDHSSLNSLMGFLMEIKNAAMNSGGGWGFGKSDTNHNTNETLTVVVQELEGGGYVATITYTNAETGEVIQTSTHVVTDGDESHAKSKLKVLQEWWEARKDDPEGDNDGDGVKNKDDMYPNDSSKSIVAEKDRRFPGLFPSNSTYNNSQMIYQTLMNNYSMLMK